MKTLLSTVVMIVMVMFTCGISVMAQQDTVKAPAIRDTSSFVSVTLVKGTRYIGKLIDSRNDTVTILTEDIGQIRIPRVNIKSIDPIEQPQFKDGKYWFPTPLPGRYFFAPSAFMLKPGEGYYQNTLIALNSFNVGVTRWFSIGGGIEFFTTFASMTQGEFRPTFFITPKIGAKVAPNLRLGAGFLYMQVAGDEFRLGTFYGVITYGNDDYNLTTGLGWGFGTEGDSKGNWSFQKKPLITICGTARVSRKVALVSENWIIPGASETGKYYPIFSYGLRFMGESISVDLLFINNKDIAEAIFIGFPLVSFTVKF